MHKVTNSKKNPLFMHIKLFPGPLGAPNELISPLALNLGTHSSRWPKSVTCWPRQAQLLLVAVLTQEMIYRVPSPQEGFQPPGLCYKGSVTSEL